jgi:putative FmdB family regulatory protein
MVTYEYVCRDCGVFELRLALGTAPGTHFCPECGSGGRRVFSPPTLARTSPLVRASREREEQSREAPEVVSEVPPSRRAPRRPHPALARLPRP